VRRRIRGLWQLRRCIPKAPLAVVEQEEVLRAVHRKDQVDVAIAIDVRADDVGRCVEQAGQSTGRRIAEASASVVEQQLRRPVVRHEDVDIAILVEVRRHTTLAARDGSWQVCGAHIAEAPMPRGSRPGDGLHCCARAAD
jgi:hypothetical protein